MADLGDTLTQRKRSGWRRWLIGPHADDPYFDRIDGQADRAPDTEFDEAGLDFVDGDALAEETGRKRKWRWRLLKWAVNAALVFIVLLLGWLIIAAPVSRTGEPLVPPPMVLTASDGTPIARMGPVMDRPVAVADLPDHVVQAFLAIEDRRFEDHWGIDPRGIARAAWTNVTSDETHGGSTITQQLAKLTYLDSERTFFRKIQEVPIALWLELWLSKDEILERYLSNVYFGDNVYGLRAASLHYFYRHPENLTLPQAAMLAGIVQAPSRLAPTRNYEGARERAAIVLQAMVDAGYLTQAEADAVRPAVVDHRPPSALPSGGYFANWAIDEARAAHGMGYESIEVPTTLDRSLQSLAERVTRAGAPRGAQVALVAMRTNGEVVAMVGGRDYSESAFNRATQAERQPGSTFKLIVYLAALESGMTPDSLIEDSPIETGGYRPSNADGTYRGEITLREAFARSSNVAAVRLYNRLGPLAIADAARQLGIEREFPANASVALGSGEMSLIELVAAYATVAGNGDIVEPHAIARPEPGFFDRLVRGRNGGISERRREQLLELLAAAIGEGTGRAARLAIPAFGKTGTTQDSRDALFVGFAGDLVVGVWIGHDDNSTLGNASGGGAPARIWRDFMAGALPGSVPREVRQPVREEPLFEKPQIQFDSDGNVTIETAIGDARIRLDGDDIRIEPDARMIEGLEEIEREIDDLAARELDGR